MLLSDYKSQIDLPVSWMESDSPAPVESAPRLDRLWYYCRKTQLCFVCLEGNGVRPCLFLAQQTGINVTSTTSQVNGYICI